MSQDKNIFDNFYKQETIWMYEYYYAFECLIVKTFFMGHFKHSEAERVELYNESSKYLSPRFSSWKLVANHVSYSASTHLHKYSPAVVLKHLGHISSINISKT